MCVDLMDQKTLTFYHIMIYANNIFFQIHASSVISLLHSDIKSALKSAFGSLDGPLSVIDWCKGHGQSGDIVVSADGSSAESNISECRDSSSTVTLCVGDAMSPSQTSVGGSSVLKGMLTH